MRRGNSFRLGSTPQYYRLTYMSVGHIYWRILKRATHVGTSAFFLTVRQPSRHMTVYK